MKLLNKHWYERQLEDVPLIFSRGICVKFLCTSESRAHQIKKKILHQLEYYLRYLLFFCFKDPMMEKEAE